MYSVLCILREVSLSPNPSCASTRNENGRKNCLSKSWGPKARKGRLPAKPESLIFRGRVTFRCVFLTLLSYGIVFLILTFSHYLNPFKLRTKSGSFSLDTRSACPDQVTFRETAKKEVVKRGHFANECCCICRV